MTSTKPAHVFISNSLDAVRKYFDSDTKHLSHEAVTAMASDPSIFFGSPSKNSTILSLTHEVSQGGGAEGNANSAIIIDALDPLFSFEQEILEHIRLVNILSPEPPDPDFNIKNMQRRVKPPHFSRGAQLRKWGIQTVDKSDLWKSVGQPLDPIPRDSGPRRFGQDTYPGDPAPLPAIKGRDWVALQDYYAERLKAILDKQTLGGSNRLFYIAFGIGTDFSEWAGPMTCTLAGIRLDANSEEVRKFTLKFIPSVDHASAFKSGLGGVRPSLERLFKKGGEGALKYIGESFKISDYPSEAYYQDPLMSSDPQGKKFNFLRKVWSKRPEVRIKSGRTLAGYEMPDETVAIEDSFLPHIESSKGIDFDFHAIIEDCFNDYLQKVTTTEGNVITLIPNVNISHKKFITKKRDEELSKFNKEIQELQNNVLLAQGKRGMGSALTPSQREALKHPKGGKSKARERIDTAADRSAKFIENPYWSKKGYVRSVLREFSIDLVDSHSGMFGPQLPGESRPAFTRYTPNSSVLNLESLGTLPVESVATFSVKYDDIYPSWSYIENNRHDFPLYALPVQLLMKGLNKADDRKKFKIVTLMETNTKILNFWYKQGLIKLPKPTLIFGDLQIIKDFLYGKLNILSKSFEQLKLKGDIKEAKYLHPDDQKILLHPSYMKGISTILRRKPNLFFTTLEDMDNFMFTDKELKKNLDTLGNLAQIPIFKAYTKNGNVLSTKLKVDESYLAFAKLSPQAESLSTTNNRLYGTLGNQAAFLEFLPEVIVAIEEWIQNPPLEDSAASESFASKESGRRGIMATRKTLNPGKSKADLVHPGESRQFENVNLTVGWDNHVRNLKIKLNDILDSFDNKNDLIATILAIYEINTKESNRPTLKVDDDADAMSQLINLFDSLYSYAYQLSIKTYPNFSLSMDSDVLATPCVLLSQTPHIKSSTTPASSPAHFDKLLTGVYSIIGFKHVLSRGAVLSEFRINKSISGNLNKNDIVPPTPESESSEPWYRGKRHGEIPLGYGEHQKAGKRWLGANDKWEGGLPPK